MPRDQDRQGGEGADDKRIDEGAQHGDQALADRTLGLCGRMSDRGRTETGLVREYAARHAKSNGCPDGSAGKAAGRRGRREGMAEDQAKGGGNLRDIQQQNQ